MATNEQCDRYAAELTQRFEELTQWAIANWPHENFRLLASDFNASRRELGQILGPKLGEGTPTDSNTSDDSGVPFGNGSDASKGRQYRDVNPMPWP